MPGVRGCVAAYWTIRRYAPEVIASMNHAIDALKHDSQATTVILVGYSGGGRYRDSTCSGPSRRCWHRHCRRQSRPTLLDNARQARAA